MFILLDSDFQILKKIIYKVSGINITDAKKTMVEARLQKRLKYFNMKSFSEYCKYITSERGMNEELSYMIDEITTNKTDFFREQNHFEFLISRAIPNIREKREITIRNPLKVWSAGCSSGEEPYTLAMVLMESRCHFEIIATDISNKMIEKAKIGIYSEDKIEPIPIHYRKKYILKHKDPNKKIFRIVKELREKVKFIRLNFMDDNYNGMETVDIIFCRNVIIYFEKKIQETILNKLCVYLKKDGYIFMGHSENLFGINAPLVQVAPTIYKKI